MSGEIRIADLSEAERAWLQEFYEHSRAALEQVIRGHGLRAGLSAALARERIAILDRQLDALGTAMVRAGTPVACAKGCAFCCTLTIDVSPDEVFAIAAYLEAQLAPDSLAALKERAVAADARGHGLAPLDRHRLRLFCPVMDPATRACLAHAVRPNPCQGYLSLDVAACEADHRAPPGRVRKPALAALLAKLVGDLRSFLLSEAGAPDQRVELTAALVAHWRDGERESDWLAGRTVFPDATTYEEAHQTDA